jgi:protein gp37
MGDKSKIQWTEATWNPVVGCTRVSAGCQHCYAERVAHRGMAPQHRGLTVVGEKGPRWNGQVRFVPHVLDKPLRWKRPRRIFVNSLSDLFHESLSEEQIAAVFGVMAASPQHTFQVLTKRPARMVEWFRWAESYGDGYDLLRAGMPSGLLTCAHEAVSGDAWEDVEPPTTEMTPSAERFGTAWPLPNVWLGCSVEDQATADERIPLLVEVPAALRWVSYEPALGPVNFRRVSSLDWIVVGGESGPGARPFDVEWARSAIRQGREAGVPAFVKQLGANRYDNGKPFRSWGAMKLRDRKGGEPEEWPEDLRVREWPEAHHGLDDARSDGGAS